MGVDVVYGRCVHMRVAECALHGRAQACSLGMRGGNAVAVARLAPADQFGVDAHPAPPVPTNPSRWRSKGREAVSGSGLLERTRRLENGRMLSAVTSSAATTSIRV